MTIQTDQRRIWERDEPAAREYLERTQPLWLDLQIRIGQALAIVNASAAFASAGRGSLVQYGTELGYPAATVYELCALGSAMAAEPRLQELVRTGEVCIPSAAALAPVLTRQEQYVRPGDDWLNAARTSSTRDLRRQVRQRLEEQCQQAPAVVELSVYVSQAVRQDFERARLIASRRAGQALSNGEAVGEVVHDYLEAHDPGRMGAGRRRVGPTAERPASRYVPAEVRRALRKRSGDRCEVKGCPNTTFLQIAHLEAHAKGSGRELEDLAHLCTRHHTMLDAGTIGFAGFDDEGRPKFTSFQGDPVGSEAGDAASREMPATGPRSDAAGAAPDAQPAGGGPESDSVSDSRKVSGEAETAAPGGPANGEGGTDAARDVEAGCTARPAVPPLPVATYGQGVPRAPQAPTKAVPARTAGSDERLPRAGRRRWLDGLVTCGPPRFG